MLTERYTHPSESVEKEKRKGFVEITSLVLCTYNQKKGKW
jgi:hypothetical protein